MQQSILLGRHERLARAAQVGALLRWHRENYVGEDGRKGLSQSDVLGNMAPLAPDEGLVPADTSTWSRLERGRNLPTRERLELFGQALDLSPVETDGLLLLAGFETATQQIATNPSPKTVEPAAVSDAAEQAPDRAGWLDTGMFGERGLRPYLTEALGFCLFRFLLPAGAMAGAGYLLSSLGVTATWILILYIGLAMGLVVFQGFLKMRRACNLRDLLFVSLFFVLSTGLLQIPFVRMDHYGFYNLGNLGGTALPIVLVLSVNLLVALIASLMFDLLWRWQYSGHGADKAYQRALWVAVPPMVFTYLCVVLISNSGAWIGCSIFLTIMAGVFAMLTVMRDETVEFTGWDRRFLLWCSMQITIVLATLGAVSAVAGYLHPAPELLTGHSLFYSWDIDYAALGYSEHELINRLRLGYTWNAVAGISYMVVVIGGYLALSIYRLGGGEPTVPTADVGELPAGEAPRSESMRKRIKSLLGPGRLAGHPLLPQPA